MVLYIEAKLLITINGEQGTSFWLERWICQGFFLAPYLFFFQVDAVGYILDDSKYMVEGLTLSKSTHHTTSIFVDDTLLFLKSDYKNLQNIMKVLDLYYMTFGAKINLHKITTTWASLRPCKTK